MPRISNPALEQEPDAPPEKMRIHFARAEVVVLGSGLKRLEQDIQKYELKFVKSADRQLAATLNTHIAAVTVTLTNKNGMTAGFTIQTAIIGGIPGHHDQGNGGQTAGRRAT